jgi:hypothetical protein
MKGLLLVFISFLFSFSELGVYKNDDFRFELQFPQPFEEEIQTQDEKFGTLEQLKVSGKEGGVNYMVVAYRYTTNESFKRTGTTFQELVYSHTKYINQEGFINSGFIIISEGHTKDALNYVLGNPSLNLFMHRKVFISNDIAYSLSIWSKEEFPAKEKIESFFKGLKIKK